jgi:hypothetical protein
MKASITNAIGSEITCSAAVQPATDGRQSGAAARGLRPFDAQLAAARDRRSIGLYDARFHSTSWCVHCCPHLISIGAAIQHFFWCCVSGHESQARRAWDTMHAKCPAKIVWHTDGQSPSLDGAPEQMRNAHRAGQMRYHGCT